MKRWMKISLIVAGSLIVLIGSVAGMSQTAWFRNWLRERVEKQAGKYINGRLTIGSLEGNLITTLRLGDILIADQTDTVLYVKAIKVDLSPLQLLHRVISVDSVAIESPYFKLIQAADSSWNVSHIRRKDTIQGEVVPTDSEPSSLRYLVGDFVVKNGAVRVSSLDTSMPSLISEFGARFTANYTDTAAGFELKELGFQVDRPGFRLVKLSLNATRRGSKFTFSNLSIQTERNQLGGGGTYVAADSAASSGTLSSKPFDFSEFRAFMPGILLSGSPVFELETHLVEDSLTTQLGIIEGTQRIDLRADIAIVSALLNRETRDKARYYVTGTITNFALGHWLVDSTMDYSANGTFALSGQGLSAGTAKISASAAFTDVLARGHSIGRVTLSATYDREHADAKLDAEGTFGKVSGDVTVDSILTDQQYSAQLAIEHLNIAPIMQDDSLQSDLNFSALIEGSHFDPKLLDARARIDMSKSSLRHVPIDSVYSRMQFGGTSFKVDTLHASSPLGSVSGSGSGEYSGVVKAGYSVKIADLASLGALAGQDSLGGKGFIDGKVSGRTDSFLVNSSMTFEAVTYGSYSMAKLVGSGNIEMAKSNLNGTAKLVASKLLLVGTPVDSVLFTGKFAGRAVTTDLDAYYQPGVDGHATAAITLDTPIVVHLAKLAINLKTLQWTGGSPQTTITQSGDGYEIHNLTLSAPQEIGGGVQTISLDGRVSVAGAEDFKLSIQRFDLAAATRPFELPYAIGGYLTLTSTLTGTAANPAIVATAIIDSGMINQYKYQAWRTTFDYHPEKLTWTTSMIPYQGDSLSIAGYLPVKIALDSTGVQLYRDRPMEVTIRTDSLPLDIVRASGQQFKQAKGALTANVHLTNTIHSPTIAGTIALRDAAVSLPKYGIEYSDIMARVTVDNQSVRLDTLLVRQDKGTLTGSGTIRYQDNLMSGTIKTTQIDFVADKFYAVRHKDYQIQISGDTHVTGDSHNSKFDGSITVLKSVFFLPAVMEEAAAQQAALATSVPLLVKATLKPDTLGDSVALALARKAELDSSGSTWFNNLRGQMKLAIPKNTWLKSPDMNLEIGDGDIDLVKNGPNFEIFGPIKILRGQYNLYGKRFTILQGNLLFKGGVEYNPDISMEAQYVFRTADREKRTLKVDISGKAFSPILKFTIDDNVIEERDAIAYVMYGRSMDELTSGQKSQTGSAQGDLAKGAAANMLASQLSQTLGNKLGLDVVDISSQGSLSSATLTVGKYLTNDLFMSYSRGVGQSQDQEPVPQIVTLEYELSKYFFLQLLQGDSKTSGADIIFKYQH